MSGFQQDNVIAIMNMKYEEARLEHNDDYGQENVMELINRKYEELQADQNATKDKDKSSGQLLMEALKGLIVIAGATSFAGNPQATKLATQTILSVFNFLFTLRLTISITDYLKKATKDRRTKEIEKSNIELLEKQRQIFEASAMELIESARQLWSLKGQLTNANKEDVRKFNEFTTQFAICVQMIVVKSEKGKASLNKMKTINDNYLGLIWWKMFGGCIATFIIVLGCVAASVGAALVVINLLFVVVGLAPIGALIAAYAIYQGRQYNRNKTKYHEFNSVLTANCESMEKHVSLIMKESIVPVVNIPIRY